MERSDLFTCAFPVPSRRAFSMFVIFVFATIGVGILFFRNELEEAGSGDVGSG